MKEKLEQYAGKKVLLTLKSRRVIYGVLKGNAVEGFTVKIGKLHLQIDPDQLTKASLFQQ